MIDLMYSELSKIRFDELLQEAEVERLVKRARQADQASNSINQFLLQLSDWLIDSGSWLKQRTEMRHSLS
jgi:hypothetical protein